MSKQRCHKQHEMVDYISNLPDCILHHILSFMPTREVVKTSILSTRWKKLWASVPNIDFDDRLLCARDVEGRRRSNVASFVKFVERVLRLRDASNMKKFRLSCCVFRDLYQIHAWIFYAVMHNVEEIDLRLHEDVLPVIPRCLFDSTSLVSLKIQINVVELPSHIHLPCLKTLHLSFVQFLSEDFADKLFSGCPVLENLILSDCMLIHLDNTVMITTPTLKRLTIDDDSYFETHDDFNGCKIKIDAPNLTYLEYIGHLSNEILFNNVSSSLIKANLHIPLPEERQKEVTCRSMELLKQLQNIVSLSLSNDTMESLICIDMPFHFPVFPNLMHLVWTTGIEDYTFRAVMDVLYFCPRLQSICLFEGFKDCINFREDDRIWLLIPMCVSNCLKTVTFKNFRANDSDMYFIKRVLKSACVLERMNICWSKTWIQDLNKEIEVRKELETTKRSSKTCVVKFS